MISNEYKYWPRKGNICPKRPYLLSVFVKACVYVPQDPAGQGLVRKIFLKWRTLKVSIIYVISNFYFTLKFVL